MKLPGWFRAATFTVADGVRDLRLSADRQTLHLLAWTTSMPDDGDMLTTWQHRSVDLQTGLVDVARYGREPEQTKERGSAVREFWQRVEAQTGGAPLQPVPPSPLAWRFQDPNQSDTEKPKGGPFLDGLLIARNEELRGARVSVLRGGQVIATHALAGATSLGQGARMAVWVGAGRDDNQVLVLAGGLRPSLLVVDAATGAKQLHTRI